MASIDTLITNAKLRADAYAQFALGASVDANNLVIGEAAAIRALFTNRELSLNPKFDPLDMPDPPDLQGDYSMEEMNNLVAPDRPELRAMSTGGFDIVIPRDAPTVNIAGLFEQEKPSSEIPAFGHEAPDLSIDALSAELARLAAPILREYEFPAMTELNLRDAPTITLPELDERPLPDDLRDPDDYHVAFVNAFNGSLNAFSSHVQDRVSGWLDKYAPGYQNLRSNLENKLTAYLEGTAGVLPDEFETAMYNRAVMRSKDELLTAQEGLLTQHAKRGFAAPPGAVASALNKSRYRTAEILTQQATDIYVRRQEVEVQHLQFVLGMANDQVNTIRQIAVQQSQLELGVLQATLQYADTAANKLAQVFEHLAKRADVQVAVLAALNQRYEIKLRAALAALDGYKLELEAAKLRTDVDVARISAIEAQIRAESTKVQNYTALVGAIVARGNFEELKVKTFQTHAEVHRTMVQAHLASFEAYKASIDGDRGKLQGEMAKLDVFDKQLRAAGLQVDIEKTASDNIRAYNSLTLDAYKTDASVFGIRLDAAVKKFTAESDLDKLNLEAFKIRASAALDEFRALNQQETVKIDAIVKEFTVNADAEFKRIQVELDKLKSLQAISSTVVSSFSGIAQSSLNSLNTMVSNSVQAAA
jgi:hypothetical protein